MPLQRKALLAGCDALLFPPIFYAKIVSSKKLLLDYVYKKKQTVFANGEKPPNTTPRSQVGRRQSPEAPVCPAGTA